MLKELFYNCAYAIKYEEVGKSGNYAFVDIDEKLYIYLQGSNSFYDWCMNFWFAKSVYKMFKVHRGFYKAYSQMRSTLLDKCYSKEYKEIIVVGYSHGSSLATLLHEDLVYHFPNVRVRTFAFESPRALKVKKVHRHIWENLTRIEDNFDLVAHLPPKLFGYTDLGELIKVNGDTSLVDKCLPKCIKSHYPEVVLDGLKKYEQE